jgi:hypothetical protein
MAGKRCLTLIFIAAGTVQSAFIQRTGAVHCHDHTSCFQLGWSPQANQLKQRISQHKSATVGMASRRLCCSARAARTRFGQLSTACSADGADGTSNEPILEWSLPSGPPLRIISVSEAEHTSSKTSPRDVKISAANGWGDGQHATTSLCLSFLVGNAGPNKVSHLASECPSPLPF